VDGADPSSSRRVLLLDDDPVLQSVVESVCEKYEWTLSVVGDRCQTLLLPPHRPRPKLVLLGFTVSDELSLGLLQDLHATYPNAPLAVITDDSPVDVADVVGLAGGDAVLMESTGIVDRSAPKKKPHAWTELIADSPDRRHPA
jgi:DNA-binding response OmpR family regulator